MSRKTSKRWKDPTDYWNIKLFSSLTRRTSSGIPMIPRYTGEIPTQFIPANIAAGEKVHPIKERTGFAHFYLDDYQFERFWNFPIRYVKYLQTFEGTLSPDYSVYADYPEIIQRMNIYRSRALGAYWHMCGIPVIPSISWNNPQSFEWCFDGIDLESIVSISTVGALRTQQLKEYLILGYGEMIRLLNPISVIIYGLYPKELESFGVPIIKMNAFYEKFESEERHVSLE